MLGLTIEEAASGQVTDVWECHWDSVLAFDAIATQWRTNGDGPTALDYAAIPASLQMLGLPRKRWPGLFADIRVMEDAALKFFAYHRNQRSKAHG